MNENNENKDINKYLFVNLVTMLSMSAMQQLGKIINPGAGKAEINLDAAQATIDTLDMLSAKTLGNLDKDEARLMKDTISMLKMNFVETREMQNAECRMKNEKSQDKSQSEGPKDTTAKPEPQAQGKAEPPEQKSASEQANDPKFHKSYD